LVYFFWNEFLPETEYNRTPKAMYDNFLFLSNSFKVKIKIQEEWR